MKEAEEDKDNDKDETRDEEKTNTSKLIHLRNKYPITQRWNYRGAAKARGRVGGRERAKHKQEKNAEHRTHKREPGRDR